MINRSFCRMEVKPYGLTVLRTSVTTPAWPFVWGFHSAAVRKAFQDQYMSEPFAIPFSRPYVVGTEQAYIAQTFANRQLAGEGPFTLRCQALLERELPEAKVLLTPSC